MWSYARVNLRLSSQEFYSLSPRQFALLVKQNEALIERGERLQAYLMGELIAMVGNSGNLKFERPLVRENFVPSYLSVQAQEKPKRRNHKRLNDQLRRTMERLVVYQKAQVERGLAS